MIGSQNDTAEVSVPSGVVTDYTTHHPLLKITSAVPTSLSGNCDFVTIGDVFKTIPDKGFLTTEQIITAGVELSDAMTPGGSATQFIVWRPLKITNATAGSDLPSSLESSRQPISQATRQPTPKTQERTSDGDNQFALDLYAQLKSAKGNIFVSPFSIAVAMAMADEGARGQTAKEIQSVFHFPGTAGARQQAYSSLMKKLSRSDSGVNLSIANALWAQKDYPLSPSYKATIQKFYGSEAMNVDFAKAAEKSRSIINQWVSGKTSGNIKDLLPPGSISRITQLVLTNTIYFKGKWDAPFTKQQTTKESFTNSAGANVVPMMQKTSASLKYAETDQLQLLEMPYAGKELSMVVVLPKKNNLKSIEQIFTPKNLATWSNQLRLQTVNVYFPTFKFTEKYLMQGVLKKMGMPTAFSDEKADFLGMTTNPKKRLKIDTVIHQSTVDVNEEGTEASAATALVLRAPGSATAPEHVYTFRADHPFLFFIQDNATNTILFLGRMNNPLP